MQLLGEIQLLGKPLSPLHDVGEKEVCPKTFSIPELPIRHYHHSQHYLTAANICQLMLNSGAS
jgi:hypothetical protein